MEKGNDAGYQQSFPTVIKKKKEKKNVLEDHLNSGLCDEELTLSQTTILDVIKLKAFADNKLTILK